jgi:hypothetical protein
MNLRKSHQEILKTLWGVDIAKFPAHLSTINLAVNDLSVDENYPQIFNEDFFDLSPIEKIGGDEVRKKELATLSGEKILIPYPKIVDCIVGNPPYTRQEEITEITGQESYKKSMIDKALYDEKRKLADISKRAGIHAYFFVHGTKFLKDKGRFGFIVSNSWMDVDYGKGLQELFLKNYKIIAIIESKVERWFEDADVNTCIIILEKCKDQKEREENFVRFVYLFKPLRHFIPPAHDMWEKQKERLDAIDNLIKTVLIHNNFYQNDEIRIYPKKQSELWEEGFDAEENKYTGSKWGKYLRAPEIFFKILENGKDKLVPLKEIADVRFGIKTGANEFFYLTEEEIEKRKIEKQYLQPAIFSLKEVKGYKLNKKTLTNKIIICHKTKEELRSTNLLEYINWGEKQGYDKRPTCASRKPEPWYSLGKDWHYAPLIFPAKVGERMPVFLNDNVFEDKKLYGITPKDSAKTLILAALLNSTISRFFIEFTCRQLTGSQAIADIDVVVVESLPIIDVNKISKKMSEKLIDEFENLTKTYAESISKEVAFAPEKISLEKIKPSLRELDKIVMGDILGLTENEQLEVYHAVVDLVKSRIEKAKSVGKKGKTKEGIDVELLTRTIKEKLRDKFLGHFYREKILSQKNLKTVKLFHPTREIHIKNELWGWRLSSGKEHIDCQSEAEAEYLKIWLESGLKEIKVPKDEDYLLKILPEIKSIKTKTDRTISDHISSITSQKLQQKILQKLQGELFEIDSSL